MVGELSFQNRASLAVYQELKGKTLPEGLRDRHKALENILGGFVPGNSYIALLAFEEALPDYAEELKDLCQ